MPIGVLFNRAMRAVLGLPLVAVLGCEAPENAHKEPEAENYRERQAWIDERLGRRVVRKSVQRSSQKRALLRAAASTPVWQSIGPQPGQFNTGYGIQEWSGRVNAITLDPTDSNVVYLGSDGGGVWRSQDAGVTWLPISDQADSLQITALAVDPTLPTTIYAGTGMRNFSNVGILRSVDGGLNWPATDVQFGIDERVTSLAVRPGDSSQILAGMDGYGIYRSTTSGQSWTPVWRTSGWAQVLFHPTIDVAYAGIGPPASSSGDALGILKSTDGGVSWTPLSGGLPAPSGRVHLAISRSQPDTVYAVFLNGSTGAAVGLYQTIDGGLTWTPRSLPNYCAPYCDSVQALAVHPTNPGVIFLGGFGLWRSINGGQTWIDVSTSGSNYLHVDQHALAISPDGLKLYAGNDGGVWMTPLDPADPTSYNWVNLNSTLGITQFYSISVNSNDPNMSLGGTQDNNTQLSRGGATWEAVKCGDGLAAAIAGTLPPTLLTTCYPPPSSGIALWRSADWGSTWSPVTIGGSDRASAAPPFAIDPTTPSTIYTGTVKVWKSVDSGASWSPISDSLLGSATVGFITAIAVAPSQPDTLYVGTSTGRVFVRMNSSSPWDEHSSGIPSGAIRKIAIPRQRPGTAYIAVAKTYPEPASGSVLKTTDFGQSPWTNLGAPEGDPVVGLALFDSFQFSLGSRTVGSPNLDRVIAAIDSGVYELVAGAWSPLGAGLPRARFTDLAYHTKSPFLRVSTYGRGVWQLGLESSDIRAFGTQSPGGSQSTRRLAIAVVNNGPSAATNVRLALRVTQNGPSRPTYTLETMTPGSGIQVSQLLASGTIGTQIPQLPPGGRIGFTVKIDWPPSSRPGRTPERSLRIEGVAAADSYDGVLGNNRFETILVWPATVQPL